MFDSPDLSRRLGCGGVLISSKHILTSIKCVDWDSHSDYILLGDTVVGVEDAHVQTIQVSNYILHEDISVNLAILEMAEPVELDKYPNIKPICLPEKDEDFSDFDGTVTGWAYKGVNGYNSWLHKVNVRIKDGNKSQMRGQIYGNNSSCYGDSGGPLVVSDPVNNNGLTLAGIIYENDCDSDQTFIKVSQYIDWITSVIQHSDTCPHPPYLIL